jgi:hypothetical protein
MRYKTFYLTALSVQDATFEFIIIWSICPYRCTFIGPNEWKSLGAMSWLQKGWFMIFQPVVASVTCVKFAVCRQALSWWWSLTISQVFSYKLLGAHHCKASYCNNCALVITQYGRKSTWIWIPNTLLWSCQLTTVSWIFWVVEIHCGAIPC